MRDGVIMEHCSKRHLALNVSGALAQCPNTNKMSYANHDDGRAMTYKELREYLTKAKFEGKRLLPMGDCDNFDYETGCRGHGKWCLVTDIFFEEGNG